VTRIPPLHAVTDDRVLRLPDFLDRARALALGPAVALHLRGTLPARELLGLADALRAITAATGTRLMVHDRVDLAGLCDADGVHLPSHGLPVAAVRRLVGDRLLLGRSTHASDHARAAVADGADYAFLGAIWPTASHPDRAPLGPAALRRALPVPVIAIGGVTPPRAAEARAAGACGVAAIRAVWDADDPAAAARALLLSLGHVG
jgi:thiamine-phosphate pyrophosphorylase